VMITMMVPAAFIVFFALVWLLVSVILGYSSGWYSLMRIYPDLPNEEGLDVLTGESGMVGPVSMHGILKLSPCRSGLRVGMMRLFGPFSRDFLVPWNTISVSRKTMLGWRYAELSFGTNGRLRITDLLANRLWQIVPQSWPEKGMPQQITDNRLLRQYFLQWLTLTTIASVFFIVAPRIAIQRSDGYPPVVIAVLFPAIVIGAFCAFQYLVRKRELRKPR
jgi:hypothetical protein